MVTESGKIIVSAYLLMNKMLQTLPLSYPDRHQFGKKIQVLLINQSKFNNKDDVEENIEDFVTRSDEEDPKKEKKEEEKNHKF